ncbi:MAG: sulfurtransferase TusA family protein [Thermoplasmata archaeon]
MNEEELKRLKADMVVDARGIACPGPLLGAKRGMASVPKAGVLEVLSSDIGTTLDVPAWAYKVGHVYLGMIIEPGYWRIYVKRGK